MEVLRLGVMLRTKFKSGTHQINVFLNNNEKPKRINVVIYKGKSFKFTVRLQFIYSGTYLYYSTQRPWV